MTDAVFGNPKDAVESLTPAGMALGQVVPYEFTIDAKSSAPGEDITVVVSWETNCTGGAKIFGFDPYYGVYCAFIDEGDTRNTENASGVNATVNWTWQFVDASPRDYIEGTFNISGLEADETIVLEMWVVLKTELGGSTGTVQVSVEDAYVTATPADKITVGAQTVPLKQIGQFESLKADLSILKSDPGTGTAIGDQFNYTIIVTNNDLNQAASNVIVNDTLDSNTSYVGVTANRSDIICTETAGIVTCDIGILNPKESVTIEIRVEVLNTAPTGGTREDGTCDGTEDLCNVVVVNSTTDDPDSTNNANNESTDVKAPLVINVTKTAYPTSVPEPGGTITYTVTVENQASSNATLDSLNDDMFGNLTDPSNPLISSCNCSAGVTLTANGGNYSCSFNASISGNAGDTHTNTVTANASNEAGSANDTDSETVTITDVPAVLLEVVKSTTTPSLVEPGGTFYYSATITNPSTVDTANITAISDSVAGALSGCVDTGNNPITLPYDLGPGETITCNFTAGHFGNAGDTFDNNVTVTATDDDGADVDNKSNTVTVTITDVPAVLLEVVKSTTTPSLVEPGGTFYYSATITNPSTVDTANITAISDSVAGALSGCVDTGNNPITLPYDLGPGETITCNFTAGHFGNAGDTFDNNVTVTATDDDGADVGNKSNTVTVTITDVPAVLLEVVKSTTTPSLVEPGGTFYYSATITNPSTVDTANITAISDSVAGALSGCVDTGNNPITLPYDLGLGETITCNFTAGHFGNAGDTFDNNVTVTATDDDGADVGNKSNTVTVTITDVPAVLLEVVKSTTTPSLPESGGTFYYSATITNPSTVDTANITAISDSVAGALSGCVDTGNNPITLPYDLGPGETITCNFTAGHFGNAGDTFDNNVTVTATDDDGADVGNKSNTVTVTITDVPAVLLEVVKSTTTPSLVEPGGTFYYSATITNPSTVDTANITAISDSVAGALSGCVDTGNNPITLPYDLGPGETITCNFTAGHFGNAGDTFDNNVTVTATDDDGADVGNKSNTVTVTITDVPAVLLEVVKSTTTPSLVEPGGTFYYSATITNPSTVDTANITAISDSVAGALSGCVDTGNNPITLPYDLGLGETITCNFTAGHFGNAGDTFDNNVTVTATDDDGADVGNKSNTVTVTITDVPAVLLEVVKSTTTPSLPESGGTFYYSATITNPSTVDTANITAISDSVAGALSGCVDTGNNPITLPYDLGLGETITCNFTAGHFGNAGDTFDNNVTVTATDDDGADVGNKSNTVTVTITDVPAVLLEVVKSTTTPSLPESGGTFYYSATITNPSTVDTANITAISDSVAGALSGCVDTGNNPITLPYDLGLGETITCNFTAGHFGNAGDTFDNNVTVTATDDDGADVGNKSNTVTVTITGGGVTAVLLEVVKSTTTPSLPESGGTFYYSATITNPSTVDTATITAISDSVAGALSGCATLPYDLGPGETITCNFTADHFGNAGDTFDNNVTVTATDDDGDDVGNKSNTVTVEITDVLPDITVTKTANPTSVPETGGYVEFTITVTNNGLENVTIDSFYDTDFDLGDTCPDAVGTVLASGEIHTCTFTEFISGNVGEDHENIVTAVASDDDGNSDTDSATATVVFTATPPVTPKPVPAMTPVGTVLLTGLLGLIGAGVIMRRR